MNAGLIYTSSLPSLEAFIKENDMGRFGVSGDCMEGAEIMDGGSVVVDFTRMPRAPKYGKDGYHDPCLCLAGRLGRTPALMVKAYDGRWGNVHTVVTQYASMWQDGKLRLNVGLFAEHIFGVVIASYDRDGTLLWKRSPEKFPCELPAVSTVRGDNCGPPMLHNGVLEGVQ